MRIENGKRVDRQWGERVPTQMVSFRAEPSVIEMINNQMEIEKVTKRKRSEFIVRVLTEYCNKNEHRK